MLQFVLPMPEQASQRLEDLLADHEGEADTQSGPGQELAINRKEDPMTEQQVLDRPQPQAAITQPSNIARNAPVWVRIRASAVAPEALVPGIVIDPTAATREVIRSQAKGGGFPLPNSVLVVSYRAIPGREAFYVERPEALIGITIRTQHIPAVDGPDGADINLVVNALRQKARESLARLAPKATDEAQEAAAAALATAPALAIA